MLKVAKSLEGKATEVSKKITYDPNKRYTWTPEDKFDLTGEQFGMILNAFRSVLSTPEAARILMIDKANEAIESIMIKGVEGGVIREIPESK